MGTVSGASVTFIDAVGRVCTGETPCWGEEEGLGWVEARRARAINRGMRLARRHHNEGRRLEGRKKLGGGGGNHGGMGWRSDMLTFFFFLFRGWA